MYPSIPAFLHRDFRKIFNISITAAYWDRLFGFDIVKFDEQVVKSRDGESMEDAVRRQYGEDGVSIILKILNWEGACILKEPTDGVQLDYDT